MAAEGALECDVAIIGGGPAGLAAATELRRLGVAQVMVIERETQAGGIPRHCGHYPFGMREFRRLLRGPDYAARLVASARAAGVRIFTQTSVTALLPGARLSISTPGGIGAVLARHILLATGVREKSRAARLIGGTKPGGIMSTGALQGLVYLESFRPFRRPVILGSELVSFSALLTCRHARMKPVAMVEPGVRITAYAPSALLPRLSGVALMLGTEITRIYGERWIEAVELRDGLGRTRILETDGLVVSGQFQPEASLVGASHLALDPASGGPQIDQFSRCSDPAFFAAGNLLRPVETAGWSWQEGRAVARAIAASLAGKLPVPDKAVSIALEGTALKYAVPQRIVRSCASDPATRHLQLRVNHAVRGSLVMSMDGRELARHSLRALPERRILVPLPDIAQGAGSTLELSVVESAA